MSGGDYTQTIYRDSDPSYPAVYTVPADQLIRLSSVHARWNNAAASGDAILCLDHLTQDDKILGRYADTGTTVSAGDTARTTHGPF